MLSAHIVRKKTFDTKNLLIDTEWTLTITSNNFNKLVIKSKINVVQQKYMNTILQNK